MIIAVTGGRKWRDAGYVARQLYAVVSKHGITELHDGGANGWDKHCRIWANANCIPNKTWFAQWRDLSQPDARIRTLPDGTQYDANAGHRRNMIMLTQSGAQLLVAGPGGYGTADCIKTAHELGIPVWDATPDAYKAWLDAQRA